MAENLSVKSMEEMWKVIEDFGIDRKIFEKSNPSYEEIKYLYLFIKKGKKITKNSVHKTDK